jgi:hypothetical protein
MSFESNVIGPIYTISRRTIFINLERQLRSVCPAICRQRTLW